jgi:hypothetical protein
MRHGPARSRRRRNIQKTGTRTKETEIAVAAAGPKLSITFARTRTRNACGENAGVLEFCTSITLPIPSLHRLAALGLADAVFLQRQARGRSGDLYRPQASYTCFSFLWAWGVIANGNLPGFARLPPSAIVSCRGMQGGCRTRPIARQARLNPCSWREFPVRDEAGSRGCGRRPSCASRREFFPRIRDGL